MVFNILHSPKPCIWFSVLYLVFYSCTHFTGFNGGRSWIYVCRRCWWVSCYLCEFWSHLCKVLFRNNSVHENFDKVKKKIANLYHCCRAKTDCRITVTIKLPQLCCNCSQNVWSCSWLNIKQSETLNLLWYRFIIIVAGWTVTIFKKYIYSSLKTKKMKIFIFRLDVLIRSWKRPTNFFSIQIKEKIFQPTINFDVNF